jgi:hypothetical protein
MRAFRVALNGEKVCLVGIGDEGVVTAIVSCVTGRARDDLSLEVGGLVSSANEDIKWINQKPLRVGDELQIKIVEATLVDKPTKRHRIDPGMQLRSKKRYVRMMAKELGWKVQTQPKRSAS